MILYQNPNETFSSDENGVDYKIKHTICISFAVDDEVWDLFCSA